MTRFLFDTAFDQPRRGAAAAPRKEKPVHTPSELAQARQQGFAEGHAAGLEAARSELAGRVAAAIVGLQAALPQLAADHAEAVATVRRDAAGLALAIAAKLAPALIGRRPLAEIEALIADCLNELSEEPRFAVRVAPELADPLAERLEALKRAAGFRGEVVVLGEDGMAQGDCRIEWADGGMARDLQQLTAAVVRKVNQAVALI
jgi:flagellar assembly protein FliH